MAMYYFDSHDGTELTADELGVDLPDIDSAKREAIGGLVDLARDIIQGAFPLKISILVRDGQFHQLLRTSISFELEDFLAL